MGDFGFFFGIVGLAAGCYCFYAYYQMRAKGEINQSIFLPKGVELKKCTDPAGYIKDTALPTLVMAAVLVLYGALEMVNTYVADIGNGIFAAILVVCAVLIWFAVAVRKANKKYYGL